MQVIPRAKMVPLRKKEATKPILLKLMLGMKMVPTPVLEMALKTEPPTELERPVRKILILELERMLATKAPKSTTARQQEPTTVRPLQLTTRLPQAKEKLRKIPQDRMKPEGIPASLR